jgi:hypothetical protein
MRISCHFITSVLMHSIQVSVATSDKFIQFDKTHSEYFCIKIPLHVPPIHQDLSNYNCSDLNITIKVPRLSNSERSFDIIDTAE